MMKMNKWTLGLAAVGLVTIPVTMQAEEKMSALSTALSNTSISGYVNTSAHWAIGSGRTPPAYSYNTASKQDGFNLNVVNLVIEKPLDAQEQWAAGYKIDMIYGPDAVGYNNSFGTRANGSDFGLKQAYVALRAPVGNGIDFKLGTFDSIIGYEVFNAGSNPNYSRSYGYTAEPKTHTGLLASYQFCKEFGIAAGVANTFTPGINTRSWLGGGASTLRSETDKTYMGAVTLSAPDSWGWLAGSTLYGAVVNGFGVNINGTGRNDSVLALYTGFTLNTPVKGLKAGASYDHIANTAGLGSNTGVMKTFNSFAGYISYQATEKLSFHGRGEYVSANTGNFPGAPNDILAVTGTVQYDLWANVLSRVEFRWDHDLQDSGAYWSNNNDNAFLLALNVIYKF